jgi:hypothetical protein
MSLNLAANCKFSPIFIASQQNIFLVMNPLHFYLSQRHETTPDKQKKDLTSVRLFLPLGQAGQAKKQKK